MTTKIYYALAIIFLVFLMLAPFVAFGQGFRGGMMSDAYVAAWQRAARGAADTDTIHPVGMWLTGAENLNDLSSYGNDGAVGVGTAAWSTNVPSGRSGSSWANNTTRYIEVADSDSLSVTGALTIAVWVYDDESAGNIRGLVTKNTPTGNQRAYRLLAKGSTSADRPSFFSVTPNGTTASIVNLFTASTLPFATWQHQAATFEPSTAMRYWRDGSVVTSVTSGVPAGIFDSTAVLQIGEDSSGNRRLIGQIYDVRVYNVLLSAANIARVRDGQTALQSLQ